jgi:raffinose/stachyose/melibiose transport system permease protein
VTVAILPLLILVRDLGLLDNPIGLALPEAAFALPLTIIILRPFFRSIPTELEDAASIDGCGSFGFFFRILLPLSRPVLVTVAVLAIVSSWNQFLLPLVMLSSQSNWTLPLGLTNFSTNTRARRILRATLALVPALAFYLIASASSSAPDRGIGEGYRRACSISRPALYPPGPRTCSSG